jgi:hypothetical protein
VRTTSGSSWLRIGGSLTLAILAGVVVWLIVKGKDDANKPVGPTSTATAVTLSTLRALPGELGHDVYWTGEDPAYKYELTQVDRSIYVRYLPPGVGAGDPRPDFLTVGTYPAAGSYSVLRRQGRQHGNHLRRVSGGGVAVWSDSRPQSVYVAFPRSDLQVEVYDTSAARALRLVVTGAVKPIR